MDTPKKKPRLQQKWRDQYHEEWPQITKSNVSENHAFCTVCRLDFLVSHGGRGDCSRHVESDKHKNLQKAQKVTPSISGFFQSAKDYSVTRAEVLFTEFLTEHNIPLSVSDHTGPLFRRMFPDSEIAKKYSCAQTKTKAVVTELAKTDVKCITKAMQKNPYCIATDGSTDYSDHKLYPLIVRYFEESVGQVVSVLLAMPENKESSTGKKIFEIMDNELRSRDISWNNCLCFGADNANVMQGLNKGVAAFILVQNPQVYMLGCACHLMHLAADKATKMLPCPFEDMLVDIYFYLDKSSNRQQALHHFQDSAGVEIRKIVKHVSTRWLSLGNCIQTLLQQWEPLQEYFRAEFQKEQRKSKSDSSSSISKTKSATQKGKDQDSAASAAKKMSKSNTRDHLPSMDQKEATKQKGHSSHSTGKHTSRCDKGVSQEQKKTRIPDTACASKDLCVNTISSGSKSSSVSSIRQFDINAYLFKNKELGEKRVAATKFGQRRSSSVHADKAQKEGDSKGKLPKTSKSTSRPERVTKMLDDPNNKLYCYFLKASIPVFTEANILLQSEKPCIHILKPTLDDQLKSLMVKFVKPTVLKDHASDITKVRYYKLKNQREDENLFIGQEATDYLQQNAELDEKTFYGSVRQFYCRAVEYMLDKFPYDELLLKHAQVANIQKRLDMSFSSVRYFTSRFSCLALQSDEMDKMEKEFLSYQVENLSTVITECDRMDTAWHLMSQVKDASGNVKYANLVRVMKSILTIFHSNAGCERVFSLVTKTKTKFRPSMSSQTLNAIVGHKQFMAAKGEACYQQQHSDKVLAACKSATYESQKK